MAVSKTENLQHRMLACTENDTSMTSQYIGQRHGTCDSQQQSCKQVIIIITNLISLGKLQ